MTTKKRNKKKKNKNEINEHKYEFYHETNNIYIDEKTLQIFCCFVYFLNRWSVDFRFMFSYFIISKFKY